jgi:hypothetical protein
MRATGSRSVCRHPLFAGQRREKKIKTQTMKTLIFSDLHEPPVQVFVKIESVIESETPECVVFLGDYFDQFGDSPEDAARTSFWLKKSLADPRRIHLIGNHDASYLWPNEATFCPGFTWEKEKVIRCILGKNAARSFVFHGWVDEWLLTHAGLSAQWIPEGAGPIGNWLIDQDIAARDAFASGRPHWYLAVGPKRGGDARAGGILWCDYRELEPIPGVRQIFGHTPDDSIRIIKGGPGVIADRQHFQLCLDTNTGRGPQHFAVVEDGKVATRTLS